ncbi:ExeA family protein [Cognatiyoonia sp. IB215182]|uniref:ExeA family protein n=1 Tax=Cognatiyoonia sp. IB215182 TaxID=3097353 RepID=UPI002A15606B|nr:AAA family ATPase [Cognatiyoonia sp. IB215182]MDX8353112.1 AAA family ATPase [Cognatiyoonia sp. IB215182]
MNHAINIYLDHFGLHERPFSLVPDPDFIFWSPVHERAYAMFEYGIVTRAPITLITGDVGAGKTTLLHHLLKSMGEELTIGLISNAHGTRDELLRWVLQALDQPVPADADYVRLFGQFEEYLIAQYGEGRRVILIFDEAQNLSRESLEELRMFTNINSNKDELLQLVLVGQPELRDKVRHPDFTQFAQRVASSFHLPALDASAVRDYIEHRLEVAGAQVPIFTPAACDMVFAQTRGVPRLINQLCDLSLLYAYTSDEQKVTATTVEQVLGDGVFFAGGVATDKPEQPVLQSGSTK